MTRTAGQSRPAMMDITTMDAVSCRNCGRLHFLNVDPDKVPSRQFWTRELVIGDEHCPGPVSVDTKSLSQRGLSFPHYCAMFTPAQEAV